MASFFVSAFLAALNLMRASGQLTVVERRMQEESAPVEESSAEGGVNAVLANAFMIILVLVICIVGLCTPVIVMLIKNPSVVCDILSWMVPKWPDYGSALCLPDDAPAFNRTKTQIDVHEIEDDLERQMKNDFREIHNDLSKLKAQQSHRPVAVKQGHVGLPGVPQDVFAEDLDRNTDLNQDLGGLGSRDDSAIAQGGPHCFSRGVTPEDTEQHPSCAKKEKRRPPLGLKLDTSQGFSRQVTPENEEAKTAALRFFGQDKEDTSSEQHTPTKRKKGSRSRTASPKARSKSPKQSPRKEASLEQLPAGSTQGSSRKLTPDNNSKSDHALKVSGLLADKSAASPANDDVSPRTAALAERRPSMSDRGIEELSRMASQKTRRPSLSPDLRKASLSPRQGTPQSELPPGVSKQESRKLSPPASRRPSTAESVNRSPPTSPLPGGMKGRRPSNASGSLHERPSSPPGSTKAGRPSNASLSLHEPPSSPAGSMKDRRPSNLSVSTHERPSSPPGSTKGRRPSNASREDVSLPMPPSRIAAVSPPRSDARRLLDVDELLSPKRRQSESKPSGPPMEIPRAEAWSGQLQHGTNQRFERYMLNFKSDGSGCTIMGSSQGAQIKGHLDLLSRRVTWKELHSWGFVMVSGSIEDTTPGSYSITGKFTTSRGEAGTILLSSDRTSSVLF